jgi:hypothetical protein
MNDQARENREYVRRLLRQKQPEFAALLDSTEAELLGDCRPPGYRASRNFRTASTRR